MLQHIHRALLMNKAQDLGTTEAARSRHGWGTPVIGSFAVVTLLIAVVLSIVFLVFRIESARNVSFAPQLTCTFDRYLTSA